LCTISAEWLGGWADGLLTVSAKPEMLRRVIDAFRKGGREGKPLYLQVGLSWAGPRRRRCSKRTSNDGR
jgi:hypothetical protein